MLGMCHDRRTASTGAHVCNNLIYCFYLPTSEVPTFDAVTRQRAFVLI